MEAWQTSNLQPLRLGEEKKERRIMSTSTTQGSHNNELSVLKTKHEKTQCWNGNVCDSMSNATLYWILHTNFYTMGPTKGKFFHVFMRKFFMSLWEIGKIKSCYHNGRNKCCIKTEDKPKCWSAFFYKTTYCCNIINYTAFSVNICKFHSLIYNTHSHAQEKLFYGSFSWTTCVSRCQKRTSGLYGARED